MPGQSRNSALHHVYRRVNPRKRARDVALEPDAFPPPPFPLPPLSPPPVPPTFHPLLFSARRCNFRAFPPPPPARARGGTENASAGRARPSSIRIDRDGAREIDGRSWSSDRISRMDRALSVLPSSWKRRRAQRFRQSHRGFGGCHALRSGLCYFRAEAFSQPCDRNRGAIGTHVMLAFGGIIGSGRANG